MKLTVPVTFALLILLLSVQNYGNPANAQTAGRSVTIPVNAILIGFDPKARTENPRELQTRLANANEEQLLPPNLR